MTTSVLLPAKAARALGYLKSSHNDIEIYVEDTSAQNVWIKLLRVYLPKHIRLNSVNMLGSRNAVLEACKLDQRLDERKKLYIIDSDLDLLRGIPKPKLRHLYRLRAYCVENYLIEPRAIVSAITVIKPDIVEEQVFHSLNLDAWLLRNEQLLAALFICYAVTFELASANDTISYSVHRLINKKNRNGDLCGSMVYSRIITLYRSVRQQRGKEETRAVYNRIRARADKIGVYRFVSGKDYLFPLINLLVSKTFKCNLPMKTFLTLIAQTLEAPQDRYLVTRLRSVIGRHV